MRGLIALDVDGTLLTSQKTVPEEVLDALRQARQREGIAVTLITGRTRRSLSELLDQLEIDVPYAGSNGGFIALPGQVEPLATYPFSPEATRAVVAAVASCSIIGISFHTIDQVYYDPGGYAWIHSIGASWAAYATERTLEQMVEELSPPLKIELMGDEDSITHAIRALVPWQGQLNIYMGADPRFLEITGLQANKGHALRQIAARLGVPLAQTGACGDSTSDLSLLQTAGCPVAMGNSLPAVRALGRWIAPTNDQAGAAWAIRKMMEYFQANEGEPVTAQAQPSA